MKIRGTPGHYELHPENDKERDMIGRAFRESKKWFKQFDDDPQRPLLYWGDAMLDDKPTQSFIVATWDERNYPPFVPKEEQAEATVVDSENPLE